jgi:hypothetical protein
VICLSLNNNLSIEEQKVVHRVIEYFKSPSMTLQEKVFNALLIAQNELEEHHFGSESERLNIIQFKNTLDSLLTKLCDINTFRF